MARGAQITNCLARPTSIALDEKTGTLYIAELVTGRVVVVQPAQ